ncbi:MAG: 3-deoxy-D-manno-octulosonic acid transferase [Paludibacteraceae bacterium]|nr:3-deoxy-D-manno-octulosonic acid transferase [Paludibacteraceae bacterium]
MSVFGHKMKALFRGQRQTLDAEHRVLLEANKGAIWFHAASVGEFEQARPIIEKIVERQKTASLKDKRPIVVTFFSPSGYEARKGYEQADGVYYLPFATRRNAKRFIEALQPSMAIFVKYEFWPAYIRALKQHNIPTYSICSIFRPKQYFFRWWGKGQLKVLRAFTHLYVQDEKSRQLLAAHGVPNATVCGDTRFDRMMAVRAQTASLTEHSAQSTDRLEPIRLFVEGCEQVIVAGSTWPKDEVLLAQFVERFNELTNERIKLILVPHEIDEEHLHFIFNLFKGRYVKYSDVSGQCSEISIQNILRHADVLLIDTMGLLSSIYPFGQVAYIGGGFGVGIHNTIEAAAYGMPVIFGPNYDHFREAKGLIDAGAARSIKNYSELEAALDTALENHELIGQKAAEYVQSELGATEKIYAEIFGNL